MTVNLIFTDWDSAHQHMTDNLGKGGTHRLEHAGLVEGDLRPQIQCDDPAATLGARLQAARTARGLGLRPASEQIGVSFNTLSRIERGKDCVYSNALAIERWLVDDQARSEAA